MVTTLLPLFVLFFARTAVAGTCSKNQCSNDFKLLQWNILADGLADDGFLSTVGRDHMTDVNGDTHSIADVMMRIKDAAADFQQTKSSVKLDALKADFDSETEKQVTAENIQWEKRWPRIKNVIQKHRPDIMTFQEMDHFGDFQKELEGYSSSLPGSEKYQRFGKDDLNAENYLETLAASGQAFSIKTHSNARAHHPKPELADDDGSAIFWKTERFEAVKIRYLQHTEEKKGVVKSSGAIHVQLRDLRNGKIVNVLTTHLTSGAGTKKEQIRLNELKGTNEHYRVIERAAGAEAGDIEILDGGIGEFVRKAQADDEVAIFALDANSSPYSPKIKDENVCSYIENDLEMQSVWNAKMEAAIHPKYLVSVNKMRGPGSQQYVDFASNSCIGL